MLNLLKNVNNRFLAHGRGIYVSRGIFSSPRDFGASPDGIGPELQKPKTPTKTARFGRAANFPTSLSTKRTIGIVGVHKRLPAKKLKDAGDSGRKAFDAGPTNKAQTVTVGRRIPVSINKDPVEDFRRRLNLYAVNKSTVPPQVCLQGDQAAANRKCVRDGVRCSNKA